MDSLRCHLTFRRLTITIGLMCLLFHTHAPAQSVKLPDWNGASEPPVPAAFFFQSIDGLSMLGEDGALFLCLEMPKGETKTQNGKFGFVTCLLGSHWAARLNNQFNLHFNPLGNYFRFVGNGTEVKVELQTQELARDDELIGETTMLVIVQRSGDIFSIRAVSGRDGSIYTGKTRDAAGYVLSEVRDGEGFAVGTVANRPASPERDRGKGHQGNIEFVGYTTQTVSDELAKRIALGADPIAALGEETLRWYHHSFGKLMQQAGYATAVAGKWHVGGAEHPSQPIVGFDEYCLWEGERELDKLPGSPKHEGAFEDDSTTSRYWHPCIIKNHEVVPTKPEDFGPTIFTDFLCDFMERNVRVGKPFLAYYPMVAPHGTRQGQTTCPIYGAPGEMAGPKEDIARRFRALNDYIDILVGRLEQKVRDLNAIDNTVFIFCSDNGTAVTAKSRGVERGCRVPFIVYGAGIKKRGATGEICDLSDILPTLVDFARAELPDGYRLDGISLSPLFNNPNKPIRDYVYGEMGPSRSIKTKQWNYIALRNTQEHRWAVDGGWQHALQVILETAASREVFRNGWCVDTPEQMGHGQPTPTKLPGPVPCAEETCWTLHGYCDQVRAIARRKPRDAASPLWQEGCPQTIQHIVRVLGWRKSAFRGQSG